MADPASESVTVAATLGTETAPDDDDRTIQQLHGLADADRAFLDLWLAGHPDPAG